jgi:DinB superfamily
MREQLAALEHQMRELQMRAHHVADRFDEQQWITRLAADRWSPSEYFLHLNKTSEVYLPQFRDLIETARKNQLLYRTPYQRDFVGRVMCWIVEPPAKVRVKTSPGFVPSENHSKEAVLSEFDRLQSEMIGLYSEADDLNLAAIRVVSPFNSLIKYNLYSAFSIVPAHQRRHLWQVKQLSAARSS